MAGMMQVQNVAASWYTNYDEFVVPLSAKPLCLYLITCRSGYDICRLGR